MKQVLILGGTNFIGRVLVEQLITLNTYQVTLFNRGKRNSGIFPELNQIHGDRETEDYLKISSQYWDVIIDCSGYYPISFEKLLKSIAGKVGRYIFVSTISVYNFGNIIGREITEDEPLLECTDAQKTSALPDAYGEKKAEMERLLLQQQGLDKIIIRPSLVYGKYDFTDRFYYWLWRAKVAQHIALPDDGRDITSITYVDDLARLIIAAIEAKQHNTIYNGATHRVTLKQLVLTCAQHLGTNPQLNNISGKQLINQGIQPWQDIALWLQGDMKISLEKAERDFNFTFTPFADSVAATSAFYSQLNWPDCKYGISLTRDAEVLGI